MRNTSREAIPYKIGLIEDDVLMQKMLTQIFSSDGWDCALFADAAAALERLPRERPDLLILDVNLPDLDGHELCRRLKADARTRAIPVIMLTGEARELAARVRGLELGADDYLFKPISPKVLLARSRAILAAAGGRRP